MGSTVEMPEIHPALKESLMLIARDKAQKEIADETLRKDIDQFLAKCRDLLHAHLQALPGQLEADPKMVHTVIDAIDDYLNHRSKR